MKLNMMELHLDLKVKTRLMMMVSKTLYSHAWKLLTKFQLMFSLSGTKRKKPLVVIRDITTNKKQPSIIKPISSIQDPSSDDDGEQSDHKDGMFGLC